MVLQIAMTSEWSEESESYVEEYEEATKSKNLNKRNPNECLEWFNN